MPQKSFRFYHKHCMSQGYFIFFPFSFFSSTGIWYNYHVNSRGMSQIAGRRQYHGPPLWTLHKKKPNSSSTKQQQETQSSSTGKKASHQLISQNSFENHQQQAGRSQAKMGRHEIKRASTHRSSDASEYSFFDEFIINYVARFPRLP